MNVTPASRWKARIGNLLFIVVLLLITGALAWASYQHRVQMDWTHGNRNTLSKASQNLLATLQSPVNIVAHVKNDPALHRPIERAIGRYQRFKPDITLDFKDPELEEQLEQGAAVIPNYLLTIHMDGRKESVRSLSEQKITTALQRLARDEVRWIVFLRGHGERDPEDKTNQGYQRLHESLTSSGFAVQTLSLIATPVIPENTALLVIAGAQSELLSGEIKLVQSYVERGGNVLWLRDPQQSDGLEPLAHDLGIEFIEGVVIDANPELLRVLGIQHPAVIPVVDYPESAITQGIQSQTLFPFSTGMKLTESDWSVTAFLNTLGRSWAETGNLAGEEAVFNSNDGDTPGPHILGVSLEREGDSGEQRIAVIGDSDFLANGYVGNGDNLQLGLNLFNWLSHDDSLIAVDTSLAPDTRIELDNTAVILIAAGLLLVLPLSLLGTGLGIYFRRRTRA